MNHPHDIGAGPGHAESPAGTHPHPRAGVPAHRRVGAGRSPRHRPALRSRPQLDLALVLDRSGSMHGEKLAYAKEAVRGLIDRLPATDHLSLCAYDDRVDVVFPRHPVDALVMKANVSDRRSARLHQPLGRTPRGTAATPRRREPALRRVLLLSDGLANAGSPTPPGWPTWRGRRLRSGRTVSTFGVGQDFDEDTLRTIADAGGGNYHYIASPEDLPAIFREELGELGTVVAQNLTVHFTPLAAGWSAVLGFDGLTLPAQAGDVQAGATRSVMLALHLPLGGRGRPRAGRRDLPLDSPRHAARAARSTHRDLGVGGRRRARGSKPQSDRDVLRAAGLQLAADENKAAVAAARRRRRGAVRRPPRRRRSRAAPSRTAISTSRRSNSRHSLDKMRAQGAGTSQTDRDLHLTTDWSRYKLRRGKEKRN